ncbi:hypothetical protein MKW94_002611 [Papaver nudicaule]|uniref:C2H2-type domain-containing protein n=1 Tax=Papaver nudicaule TaxID=74823 RepID=A0AA41W3C5_PAPNU|nr:hypothetical protein [Papaver nudicaule]
MHLWSLANLANTKKDSVTRSPKKRKLEDILCTENGSKKARIENETENHMDEIILGSVKKTDDLEVIRKQTPVYSSASDKFRCDNCGRPFRSPQALGGHKSSCNIYFRKNEAGESSAQGSMRNKKNKIDEHQCRLCTKSFPSGQALGGHQREHRSALVSSSVSQPMNIGVDSLCPINSSTSVQEAQDGVPNKMNVNVDSLFPINYSSTSVEEAQDDLMNKKINMMFDLNEVPPEDEDELNLKL